MKPEPLSITRGNRSVLRASADDAGNVLLKCHADGCRLTPLECALLRLWLTLNEKE